MDVDPPPADRITIPSTLRAELEIHTGPLPSSATRFSVLSTHILILPPSLSRELGAPIPPRDRTPIAAIKHRRHLYATSSPPPTELTAREGRRRWPLLWERLGGDVRAGLPGGGEETAAQAEAARWAREGFMPGHEAFVGRLGALLAEEEEVGEWEEARRNRARERRLEEQGEEFDDESDDDDDEEEEEKEVGAGIQSATAGEEDQEAVAAQFERRLLELYVDGMDTVDYDEVDFSPAHDPIAERDAEDAWFDDEAPSGGGGTTAGNGVHSGAKTLENGQGEYDY